MNHKTDLKAFVNMPKPDDLPYFALSGPLSDYHIVTLLGRAIPLNQLRNPLGGRMRPELPKNGHSVSNANETDDYLQALSDDKENVAAFDSRSAVTEVGTPQRTSGQHADGDRANPPMDSQESQGVDLLKLDSDLYPKKAIVCRDVEILKRKAVNMKAKAAVDNMLSLYTNSQRTNDTDISATSFRRIGIPNPQDRITELLKHDEYANPILELLRLQENGKVAIIVSMLTCTDLKKSQKSFKEWNVGGGVKPPGLKEGQPLPSVGVEAEGAVTKWEEFHGTYEGEVIMACSYLKLRLVPAPPEEQGAWYKISRAFRKHILQQKPPKRNDRMKVSAAYLDPKDGELYLPSEAIPGDVPTLFGGSTRWSTGGTPVSEEVYQTADEDDLAFTICA